MSPITTHVLNTAAGRPAAGIAVILEMLIAGSWMKLGAGKTDADGRLRNLLTSDHPLAGGLYRLRFNTSAISTFFPEVRIEFHITEPREHYHVPLLLSPFGYSTYRGS